MTQKMKNSKKYADFLEETIHESMFLAEILIGDEELEDALLIRFYREELYGHEATKRRSRAPAKDGGQTAEEKRQREEFYLRLLMLVHRTLHPGGTAAEERVSAEAAYLLTEEEEKGLQKTDPLIRQYYRDRRASFVPDRTRIRRIRSAIAV